MTEIKAEIVADSINSLGQRITTFVLTYPRIIHAELLTHRAFSRNAASSRAIPFKRMVEAIKNDPFIPIAWQKDHKGMQGSNYIETDYIIESRKFKWLQARDAAIKFSTDLNTPLSSNIFNTKTKIIDTILSFDGEPVTKQLCNRLLEPFQWYTSLVTATDFDNFFELRCPQYQHQESKIFKSWKDLVKDAFASGGSRDWVDGLENYSTLERLKANKGAAEIHLMALAEAMWDARNESQPEQLVKGMWHIPFMSKIDSSKLKSIKGIDVTEEMIKISTGMCARTSYTVVGEEKEVKYETLIGIHDKMKNQVPFHASPFEHCAQADEATWRSRNFCGGWKQYREILESGSQEDSKNY